LPIEGTERQHQQGCQSGDDDKRDRVDGHAVTVGKLHTGDWPASDKN